MASTQCEQGEKLQMLQDLEEFRASKMNPAAVAKEREEFEQWLKERDNP